MATERLSMRKTREILRQKLELGRSHREVGASVGLSVDAVSATLVRAVAAGLCWETVQALTDEELDERLYGAKAVAARPLPDCAYLHVERKKPGVTLELLHLEYLEKYPDGYRYTQFCERYRQWLAKRGLTMRQEHVAGEKLYVDYAGKKPHLVDGKTGEVIEVELFVARARGLELLRIGAVCLAAHSSRPSPLGTIISTRCPLGRAHRGPS